MSAIMRTASKTAAIFGIVAASSTLIGCGADTPRGPDLPRGSNGGPSVGRDAANTGGGGTLPNFGDASTGTLDDDGCTAEARLVYLVSAENDLYSFAPGKLTLTKIGALTCAAGAATPNSMAVDRAGTAWVNYSDGALFKVNTKDASCAATAFRAGQSGFTARFGMGFSSDAAGSRKETLFVSDLGTQGLGKIDTTTFALSPIGKYTGTLATAGGELTGTGDGRLYGFFSTIPASLAQIDKGTGATPKVTPLGGVATGTHWAFSFWGGDFWFYTANTGAAPSATSQVTRYRSSDGSLAVVLENVGFRIVGAGVSTCAPLTPPA